MHTKFFFWIILLLGLGIRIGVAVTMGDAVEVLPGIYDQLSYHNLAVRVLEGHGFSFGLNWWPLTGANQPTAFWSYLYTLYLVGVYALFGVHPLAARLIQAALVGALTPWLVGRLAGRVFPQAPVLHLGCWQLDLPLLATAWTAFYPYFVYYAAALMTESFYILAILAALDLALQIGASEAAQGHSPGRLWAGLGLAVGAAVLLRQVFLVFVPFLFLWLLWCHFRPRTAKEGGEGAPSPSRRIGEGLGGIWLRLALALLILVAMIAPFTWYNYQRFHRFVLLNTNAGYAFFWANHPVHGDRFVPIFTPDMPSYQEIIPPELRQLDEAALERALMKLGIQFVLEDPLRYLALVITRIPPHFMFWPLPTSPLQSNLTRVLSFGVALPFAVIGIVQWLRQRRSFDTCAQDAAVLLLGFFVVYVAIHLLSWTGIRYRLPVDPVLLIFGSFGALWLWQRWLPQKG